MRARPEQILHAAVRRGPRIVLPFIGRPLAWLVGNAARLSGTRVGVALVYHRVGEPAGDPRQELVPAMGTALFAAQVRHLARHYTPVAASDFLAAMRHRRRLDRFPVAITFDDDLASHVDVAAPLLVASGATATFFISGASLDHPYRFWWERLQSAADDQLELSMLGVGPMTRLKDIHKFGKTIQDLPPLERDELEAKLATLVGPDPPESGLRGEAVRRLAGLGVEVGFHTCRHYVLTGLDDDELSEAMRKGRDELEEAVGRPLRTISYPHGVADGRVGAAARAAGFAAGFTGIPVATSEESDPALLGRIAPSYRSVGELAFSVAWALLRAAFIGRERARTARPDGPTNRL